MRRCFLALCLPALATAAWGQPPMPMPEPAPNGWVQATIPQPVPVPAGTPLPDGWVRVPAPTAAVVPETHYMLVGAPGKHDKCQDKVCVPEPYTKKTPRIYHDLKEKDYCLPGCTPWEWLKNRLKGNYSCDQCQKCGKVRTRNVLIKKVATDECPAHRCVVKPVAGCTSCGSVLAPMPQAAPK